MSKFFPALVTSIDGEYIIFKPTYGMCTRRRWHKSNVSYYEEEN